MPKIYTNSETRVKSSNFNNINRQIMQFKNQAVLDQEFSY